MAELGGVNDLVEANFREEGGGAAQAVRVVIELRKFFVDKFVGAAVEDNQLGGGLADNVSVAVPT